MITRPIAPLAIPLFAMLVSGCSGGRATSGPPACSLEIPAAPDWRLHTDGTLLRDGLQRVVTLRGVDAGGRSKFAPFMPFDYPATADGYDAALKSYMDRAASWGIDVLRVPFTWEAVEPTQGHDDEAFLVHYDALLDSAWAHGMWTIVDFHQDVYASVFCGDGFPLWTLPAPVPRPLATCDSSWAYEYFQNADVKAAFDRLWASDSEARAALIAMWDRMVARYKDRPGVLGFDVINEPGPGSHTADFTSFEATTLTDFYAQMVPRVRAAAPGALVFVEPTSLGNNDPNTGLEPPAAEGVVFAPHFYPLFATAPDIDGLLSKWATVGASWNAPVFVGELGRQHDLKDALDILRAEFDSLDLHGMGGAEWEYSVAAQDWNNEGYSMVRRDGTEWPVAAAVLRPYARAVAGGSVAVGIDAKTRAFTFSYVPAAGVTDIAVPARAYAAGYDIALTGGCVDRSKANRLLIRAEDGASKVTLVITPH